MCVMSVSMGGGGGFMHRCEGHRSVSSVIDILPRFLIHSCSWSLVLIILQGRWSVNSRDLPVPSLQTCWIVLGIVAHHIYLAFLCILGV